MNSADFSSARRFLDLSAGRIAYVERGSGTAAIFLHGYPLSGFQWRGVLPFLARTRRCIAPDLLAMGATEAAGGHVIDAAAQAAMVIELMDRMGIREADFVGSDSGGGIAQLIAAAHPERVRSLLLTNCDTETCCPPPPLLPMIEMARAGVLAQNTFVAWWTDRDAARSPEGISGLVYSSRQHPTDEAIEVYFGPIARSEHRRSVLHRYTETLAGNFLAGTRQQLSAFTGPVRVLWGTGDRIFSGDCPGYLDEIFPNSRGVLLLAGANLFWPEEQPEILVEEAQRLWSAG